MGVCLDLDGTTLTSQQTLSPRTIASVRSAHAAGMEIVIATGRPAPSVQQFIDELDLALVCICFNGAATMRLSPGGEPRVLATIPATHPEAVVECVDRLALGCISACHPSTSYARPRSPAEASLLEEYEGLEGTQQERVASIESRLEGVLKLVAICGQGAVGAKAALASAEIGDRVRVVPAEMHVEFLAPEANKGAALEALYPRRDLERFVAIGDNVNDLEMLAVVGTGIAMRNAKEAVKARADRVCEHTNDEDGVALELEAMVANVQQQ